MSSLDEMAYSSPMRAWPPLGKLLLALSLLFGSLLSPTPLVPLLSLAIGLALLYHSCHFRLPNLVAFACGETVLMLAFSVLIVGFLMPGETIWKADLGGLALAGGLPGSIPFVNSISLQLSREGLNLAILLLCRSLAGFMVLLFFASSTPIPHFFYAMRRIGLPGYLAELTVLVYRYSFMLLEQMGQMGTAADCRLGFRSIGQTLRTSGQLVANLFSRSMDFAERAQSALLCRNFKGEFMPYRQPAPLSLFWVALPILLFAALFFIAQAYAHLLVI